MSYTDAVPLLLKLIHSFPQRHVAKELGALAVNLSLHERNAGAGSSAVHTRPDSGASAWALSNPRPPLPAPSQSCWRARTASA